MAKKHLRDDGWGGLKAALLGATIVGGVGGVGGCGSPRYLPVPGDAPVNLEAKDDTVFDPLTGLSWERRASQATYTPASHDNPQGQVKKAAAYCEALRLEDHADWRLPTRLELLSIADHTRVNPAIDKELFPGTPNKSFWTSTRQPFPNQQYAINFGDGDVTYDGDIGTPVYARCVRSTRTAPAPDPVFVISSDGAGGIVTDNRTGLRWQRATEPKRYPKADEAIAYCAGVTIDGEGGFRLPTVKELNTLIDEKSVGPAIDKKTFPGTESEWYWTASPYVYLPGYHWAVTFGDGPAYVNVSGKGLARCVK